MISSRPSRPPLRVVGGKNSGNPGNNNNGKGKGIKPGDTHLAYLQMVEAHRREKEKEKVLPLKDIPPRSNKEKVKAELEAMVGKPIDAELEKMLDIPDVLYREQDQTGTMFASDMHFNAAYATGVFFPGKIYAGADTKITKSQYGIFLSESTTDGYMSVFNAKRGVAVKARIYSFADEKAYSWDSLKSVLKNAIELAEKSPEEVVIASDSGVISRYTLRNNMLVKL